jgi:capsular polysaccharide biosynthesis protein
LENVPQAVKYDLFHLIEKMGARAFRNDPMDRIISIKEKNGQIEILTTENQLAQRIANKIKESFKNKMKSGWKIIHSHREDPVRITWKNK